MHTTIQGTQMTQSSALFLDAMDEIIDCTSSAAFIVNYVIGEITDGADITIVADGTDIVLLFEIDATGGEGYDGMSGQIAGSADEIITFDSSIEADGFVGLITTSGATASCEN